MTDRGIGDGVQHGPPTDSHFVRHIRHPWAVSAAATVAVVAFAVGVLAWQERGHGHASPNDAIACLRPLGLAFAHPVPRELNFFGAPRPDLQVSSGVDRVVEVSFRAPDKGANAAYLFFGDAGATKEFWRQLVRSRPTTYVSGVAIVWSSPASEAQQAGVDACLE
jgi:hypothetical protein